MIISDMEELGIKLDKEKNIELERKEGLISTPDSKIKLYLIPTNEELEIAKETLELIDE